MNANGLRSPQPDGAPARRAPVRTCVGCRGRDERSVLLRAVLDRSGDGDEVTLVVDVARTLPGRGAWVHPDLRCIDQAEKRRAFVRALRAPGALDATGLRDHVRETGAAQGEKQSRTHGP